MKKIVAIIFALLISASIIMTASAATGVSAGLSLSTKSVNAGGTVTVTVSANATACGSGGIEISYDSSVFDFVSGSWTLSNAFMKDFNSGSKDGVFAFESASNISGSIFKFVLQAKSGVAAGGSNVTVRFKADGTAVSKSATITIACNHSYSNNCDADCDKCGATRKVNHKWGNEQIVKEPTCKNAGSANYKCTVCGETKTEMLAKAAHTYDHDCDVDCNVCGTIREITHVFAFNCDENEHWQECTVCKTQMEKSAHTLAAEVSANDFGHGNACTVCMLIPKAEAHAFDSSCDDNCDACGYVRPVYHPYSGQFTVDKDGHWYTCTHCAVPLLQSAHIPGPEATETTDQICIICGYVIVACPNHTHIRTDDWLHDEKGHWFVCRCGETVEAAEHTWNGGTIYEEKGLITYICTDCGYEKTELYQPEVEYTFDTVMEMIAESPIMKILTISLLGSLIINIALVLVIVIIVYKNRRYGR